MNNRVVVGLLALAGSCPLALAQQTIESKEKLQEVVVTGTGTQHLLKDAPVQTEVISRQALKNFAGRSIEDILSQLSSSFDFEQGDMGSQMQMNGLGNSYILILIDGKRLHGDVGGQNDLGLIDPNNIDRIEIVKGASSALYGSDAIAGVINIITRKHDEGLMVENKTRYGTHNDVRQHNGVALRWGKISSYTNFQLQHNDGWQNTATEYTPSSAAPVTDSKSKTANEFTNWQIAERLAWNPTKAMEVYAEGSWYQKGIYRESGKYPKYDVYNYDLKYKNASATAGMKWTTGRGDLVTADVSWNKHAYYHAFTTTTLAEGFDDNGNFILDYPYFAGQKLLMSNQERTMLNVKGVFALTNTNKLSAGLEARYDYLEAPASIKGKTASDNTEAIYLQDELQIFNLLHITAGLRLNRNESFGWRLTPKLSAMLKVNDLRIRASWSQGFKTPTLKELNYQYARDMNGMILFLGNPNLKPQTSNYVSLNAEYTIGHWNISATGYYNKLGDMITLVTIPNSEAPDVYREQYGEMLSKVRRYMNMDDAKTFGADVTLRYTTDNLSLGAGYSYLDTDANIFDTTHDKMVNVTIDGMAHHKGNVFATWNHKFSPSYNLGIGIYGKFSTKRYYQTNGDGKGYQIWRLTTTHDLGNKHGMAYRIEAGIDNIFNYVDRTPHGLHLGTNTSGTTLFASLTVRFSQGKKINNIINKNKKFNDNEED
ncbi:MAG: TonB-dependent receptor plug domain-containing protein [Prevotella sp.]